MRSIRHWFYLTLRINFCSRPSSTKNVSRPFSAVAARDYFSKHLFYTLPLFERLANFIHYADSHSDGPFTSALSNITRALMLARSFFKPPSETGVRRHSFQPVEGYSV